MAAEMAVIHACQVSTPCKKLGLRLLAAMNKLASRQARERSMAIRGGRGDENKAQIRQEWELVPILHTRLLSGQEIICCCGDKVTTTYYRFDAKNRSDGKQDVLFAADGCARKLLGIAPTIAPLPLFDPLQAPPRSDATEVLVEAARTGL
jgi:hypothetical protein